MKYLIDTHIALWSLLDTRSLGSAARDLLEDPGNEICVSALTLWEISLKYSLGKLELNGVAPEMLPSLFGQMGFTLLALDAQDSASYCRLPKSGRHRDPFDRMLVWQAIRGGHTLVSHDAAIGEYVQHGLSLAPC